MNLAVTPRRIRRDTLLFYLIVMAVLALLTKAFFVQIKQADFLQSEGNKRQIRAMDIPAPRGEIFDRHGSVLALSTPVASIWCDPKILIPYMKLETALLNRDMSVLGSHSPMEIDRLKKKLADYHHLMSLLKISKASVTGKIIAKPNRRFLYLKRSILPNLAKQIDALNLPGVYVEDEYKRYYPAGETTAHLVGFTDIDGKGISGIENTYNDWLMGKAGRKQVIKDRAGNVIDFVKDIKVSKPGQSLYLSIDKDVQFFLERALKRVMIEQEPKSVSSVILDAKTGEVLGWVNLPGFNPNDRSQLSGNRIRDRVVTDVMEPGSTVKPFVMAKALEMGLVQETDKIDTSPGAITIQGHRISDTKNKGVLTPEAIIEKSSNVGIVKIAMKMKAEDLWQYYQNLGFGHDLGIFLPGESQGYVKRYESWGKIELATHSYGYGFNINLLQLARAYTVFTNEGKLLPVSVVKKQKATPLDADSQEGNQPIQVVSSEAAQAVLKMMEKVASKKGTAPQAMIKGYRVAGKTGTAHVTKRGGYEENQYNSMFVGIVPASNPKFIMVTQVNEPSRGVYYGGKVAAPVFKEVMQEVLRLYNVPTDLVKQQQRTTDEAA